MATTRNQITSSSWFPSSSSSYSSPAPSLNHDVFLSFRGVDTRNTFTSHLYTALTDAGIRTYLDDIDLQPGKDISLQLLSAIEQSRMTIIVFSKNYASSKWCLDELLHMVECSTKIQGYLIYPLFYDVDPAHVRHQISSFGDGFAKHKDADEVKNWTAALKAVANLSGWHLQNNSVAKGNEAKLIKEIVKKVLPVVKKYTTLNVAMHPVGIESRVKDVLNCISDSNTVRLIGIYGMGGAGKTTIAKAVYNTLTQQFEYSCFLENVREASHGQGGLAHLQNKLLSSDPRMKNLKVDNVDEGITLIKERFCSKQLLLVLDDLDDSEQVNSLVGDREWFGSRSVIIITTRDEHILELIGVDVKYKHVLLSDTESLELFSWHAFRKSIPTEDFFGISNKIVSYCGQLPLALVVLGSYLKGRTVEQWEDAFKKLQEIPNHHQIQGKLRMSFNGLDSDEQAVFLDIASFFIGWNQDDAIPILDACGLFPIIGISVLREKCLLIINERNELRMHDLLRDMGRQIVREKFPREPGKHSRLWNNKDVINVLKNLKGTKIVEGIILRNEPEELKFRTQTFIKMKNLRFLQINNTHLTGSFENIFKELRWLYWDCCPLDCLPSSFHPENLVGLFMRWSELVILWKDTMFMGNLKVLDLTGSNNLTTTPDLSEVPMLERLILDNCSSLGEFHPSIGLLSRLVYLGLKYCYKLSSVPMSIFSLRSLQNLNLSYHIFPYSIDFGRKEPLHYPGQSFLPSSISSCCSLEYLNLKKCNLRDGDNIPNDIGSLPLLKSLDLSGNHLLRSLPSSLGQSSNLTDLNLEECTDLESLPEGLAPYLKTLNLNNCRKLQSLPEGFAPNLKTLYLCNCSKLRSLPELPPSLEYLYSSGCESLEKIPNLKRLQSLRGLALEHCSNLAEIQGLDNFLRSSSLSLLAAYGSPNLAKTTTTLIQSLILENFIFCPGFELYLPPTQIPDWFHHQTRGSSISFDIPSTRHNTRVVGFTIWGVVGTLCLGEKTWFVISNKRNGNTWRHELKYASIYDPSSWVTYVPRDDTIQDGDRIEISVFSLEDYWELEKIGVHLASLRLPV